jgi:peroxiredoxin
MKGDDQLLPRWAATAIVMAMAIVAGAVIVLLAGQNRQLKAALGGRGGSTHEASQLAEGDRLPPLQVEGLLGERSTLAALVDRGGVMVFFTTTCPHCETTLTAWNQLSRELERLGVPFVGVSLSAPVDTRAFLTGRSVDWQVWVFADAQTRSELQVRSVPSTVVVAPDGVVAGVWSGVLADHRLGALKAVVEDQLVRGATAAQDP